MEWLVLAIILILAACVLVYSHWRAKKACREILDLFHNKKAYAPDKAIELKIIGARPTSAVRRMLNMPDYKANVLRSMISMDVVSVTEAGKYYLTKPDAKL